MDFFSQPLHSTEPAKVDKRVFLGIIWGGVAISLIFIGVRLYTRLKNFKRLYLDDAFVIFAWSLVLLTAIDWQIVARDMYQFIATTSGQIFPPPPTFVTDSEKYYRGSVIVLVFFYTSLWAIKLSFLFFFRRLAENVIGQKPLWWIVFVFTIATYFVCIGDIQYSCLALSLQKIVMKCSKPSAIHFQLATLKFNCAMDVLTDYMIMAIPINMMWRVQMSLRKKVALMCVFALAIITTVFAIVRVAVISALTHQPDVSWSYMWSFIEQCVAIIVSCLASFPSLFRNKRPSHHQGARKQLSLIGSSRDAIRKRMQLTKSPNDAPMNLSEISVSANEGEISQSKLRRASHSEVAFECDLESSTEHIVRPRERCNT